MPSTLLLLTALGALVATAYAHVRIGGLAASRHQAWVARAALVVVGIGFGWTALAVAGRETDAAMQVVLFLAAFGLVHVPAAIILGLKTWQRRAS